MRAANILLLRLAVVCLFATPAFAQQPAAPNPEIARIAGMEDTSHIAYALISTYGTVAHPTQPDPPPRLTAQCTRDPAGKLRFELLVDFGGISTLSFQAPWRPSPGDLYPPNLDKVSMTMEFLGYTKVKPVKRTWEILRTPEGELRYATPGLRSPNMESISFYLQYLKALPALRLTAPGLGTLQFETTQWQQAVKAEPLCAAASL